MFNQIYLTSKVKLSGEKRRVQFGRQHNFHMEKEQRQNFPRSCQGHPRSKEKRSITIPRSRAGITVLCQANEVQKSASTTQLSYTENEGQAVSYDPNFLYVGSFN